MTKRMMFVGMFVTVGACLGFSEEGVAEDRPAADSALLPTAVEAAEAGNKEAAKKYAIATTAAPEAVKVNQPATYRLTITPAEGYVMKVETPFTANLTGSANLALGKNTFGKDDFEDPRAEAKSITTTVTPGSKGKATVDTDVTFFICDEDLCERFKEKTQVAVNVQ